MRCKRIKDNGEQCKLDAMRGRETCHKHGGKTPRGFASPHTKTGRYSKDMPTRMVAQYQVSRNDKELLNLREEISLLDARLNDIMKRVDTGESGKLWGLLSDAFDDLKAARLANDAAKMAYYLNEIGTLIGRGLGDYAAWHEIGSLIEQRRRLVDSEAKRLKDMQMMFTAEQGMLMMGAIVSILQEHIQDRKTLDAIGRAITALVDDRAHVIDAG